MGFNGKNEFLCLYSSLIFKISEYSGYKTGIHGRNGV
jgi:hypothetical protein